MSPPRVGLLPISNSAAALTLTILDCRLSGRGTFALRRPWIVQRWLRRRLARVAGRQRCSEGGVTDHAMVLLGLHAYAAPASDPTACRADLRKCWGAQTCFSGPLRKGNRCFRFFAHGLPFSLWRPKGYRRLLSGETVSSRRRKPPRLPTIFRTRGNEDLPGAPWCGNG